MISSTSTSTTTTEGAQAPHAIIIGAGIAGCSLALFLKRAGITSTIYEAYPREHASQGTGGGLQIAPNGMHVLHHLGLADALKACGWVSPAYAFHNQYGKRLAVLPTDPHQPAVFVARAALHEVLVGAVKQEGINIEFGKRLVDLSGFRDDDDYGQNDGRVTATFDDGSSASGDLVVGADGVHSRTRAIVLGDEDPKPQFLGLMYATGFVETDEPVPEDTANILCGQTGGTLGYTRIRGDNPRLALWWRNMNVRDWWPEGAAVPTRDELYAIDIDELKARVLNMPGGWSPLAQRLVADTRHIVRGAVHDLPPLPRWYQGRAVLVGDAAHAVSPHSAQGACMALEDAMYLAKVLRLAMATTTTATGTSTRGLFPAAFRAYQNGRKARVEAVAVGGRQRGEPRPVQEGEQPAGSIQQWIKEAMLVVIFNFVVPPALQTTFSYRLEWDDCDSLDGVTEAQKISSSWSWPWWNSAQ
ncbi:FAD binding domain containing protein [Acanthamoeba castellanii str. Neff]|uniref:FAD binding domain containing protein n=1 Tax=Acanthamoeba castellanii (strain ATCC 30010 / Neff) TaxID=1257118 RepID=L8HCV6_ACACF|nr:FAD binding domain containing protein [Acanthamoeba castellanii str. Neff]ELR23057.1 FAD binding domain containing protein [Acanthamoeba castellanii str. Neff]